METELETLSSVFGPETAAKMVAEGVSSEDITQRFKKHDFVYFGITSADANKLKQTLKTAVPSNTTANNVTSSGDTTQNDDILAHDVSFRKRNCELGLSKAYARYYRCKDLAERIRSFQEKGGSVVFFPEYAKIEDGSFNHKVVLRSDDNLFAVCHEGQNRSQVMNSLLLDLKRRVFPKSAFNVEAPHGAESGFDPYQRYKDLTADNFFQYTHGILSTTPGDPVVRLNERFAAALGSVKADRYGHDEGVHRKLNPDMSNLRSNDFAQVAKDRSFMHEYFTQRYFSRWNRQGRMLYFCFVRAVPIVLGRLVEAAAATGNDCRDMFVVGLPWGDPIVQSDSEASMQKAIASGRTDVTKDMLVEEEYKRMYQQYSQIFSSSHVTTPADDAPLAVDTALANDPSPSKAAMFSPVLTQRKNSVASSGSSDPPAPPAANAAPKAPPTIVSEASFANSGRQRRQSLERSQSLYSPVVHDADAGFDGPTPEFYAKEIKRLRLIEAALRDLMGRCRLPPDATDILKPLLDTKASHAQEAVDDEDEEGELLTMLLPEDRPPQRKVMKRKTTSQESL